MSMKPKKRPQDRLQTMVCLPCDKMPASERFIVVKATDGSHTEFIKFGRNHPMRSIMQSIPIHFMDRAYDERRRKKKAVG